MALLIFGPISRLFTESTRPVDDIVTSAQLVALVETVTVTAHVAYAEVLNSPREIDDESRDIVNNGTTVAVTLTSEPLLLTYPAPYVFTSLLHAVSFQVTK